LHYGEAATSAAVEQRARAAPRLAMRMERLRKIKKSRL